MYSRDFGGIKSEGQLYNMQQEYRDEGEEMPQYRREEEYPPEKEEKRGFSLDFLRNLRLDDLILIGIGILLLLDSDKENDMIVFLIAFLLMS